jgi:hypothetical protein
MKKFLMILIIGLAFFACDDGTKKETPGVPKPTPKTLSVVGNDGNHCKVTISSPDEHLPSAWIGLCNDVVTALETAYEGANNASKNRFRTMFGNNAGAQIVLVNNLANNWEVRQGEFSTLYLKTGSIVTADYKDAIDHMEGTAPGVG